MTNVLEGFGVVWVVIAVGFVLAHTGAVGIEAQRSLSRVVFYVGSPTLLFVILSGSELDQVFSPALLTTALAILVVGLTAALVARRWWRLSWGETVVVSMTSSYVNAGNLGIPIAAYVLGDATVMAGTLLLQLTIITPLALVVLDVSVSGERPSVLSVLSRPVRNPVTLGSLLGVVVAVSGVDVPGFVYDPVELISGITVPGMLIAYGISLRLGPVPGRGVPLGQVATTSGLKLLAQPLVAYAIGLALGLDAYDLLVVTVIAALPTAQNVFVYASRYDRGVTLSRDTIFVTTFASIPTVMIVAALLA